ncbi:hypothetical protein H9X90_15520 [Faecalicatena contorta]|nr:hypothetical protein [Faecalicatena contorta]MBM6712128.1 hypothetical protein [Faecalicatena contorta]
MLFSDRKELLGLYNAVSGKQYKDPGALSVNTLENAIYMAIKNDLSFVIDSRLSLYEHQSTYSPNLPLRMLLYLADLYADLTKNENLYGRKKVMLPPPQFIIFYNGEEQQPDRRILKLSDLYEVEEEEHKLELEAVMLNINAGHNPELMRACKTLADYAEYMARIRRYAAKMPIEEAVERTITECIREGILEEFLRKYRAEAKRMSIYEYDQARHIRQEREEAWEEGRQTGKQEGIQKGRQEEKQSIALNLAKMDMTVEQIAKAVEEKAAVVEKWLADTDR